MTNVRHPAPGLPPPLPLALPDPSRRQLMVWAIWMTTAAMLLAAVAVRLITSVDPWRWWVPLALLGGIASADFASGLVHWAADSWGRADLPIIGPRLLVPFRVHHLNPDDFLRRRFLDTNGDVSAISVPPLVGLLVLPLDTTTGEVLAVGGFTFCAFGALTNQIHQWAHMPSPPCVVRLLQRLSVILPRRAHAVHHAAPYDAHYCITTGWCNAPLEAIGFFRRFESMVTLITGARPRAGERQEAQYLA